MRRKHIDKVVASRDDHSDRDRIIHVLSLEYKTLREELLVRVSGRFQFLGLMTTAAALIATGFFSRSVFGNSDWIAGILAAAVFSFGLMNFGYSADISRFSRHASRRLRTESMRWRPLKQTLPSYLVGSQSIKNVVAIIA